DDRRGAILEADLPAQHVPIAAELGLPERMAEQHDGRCAWTHVVEVKPSTEHRRKAVGLEKVLGRFADDQPLRVTGFDDERYEAADASGSDVRQDRRESAPRTNVRHGR